MAFDPKAEWQRKLLEAQSRRATADGALEDALKRLQQRKAELTAAEAARAALESKVVSAALRFAEHDTDKEALGRLHEMLRKYGIDPTGK